MNRLFLRIYLPLAATILVVLAVAFLIAFRLIPEKTSSHNRVVLTEFRDSLLALEPPSPERILELAGRMGIEADLYPKPAPGSMEPPPAPRAGRIFLPGLPRELPFVVEVNLLPRGGSFGRLVFLVFVGLLVVSTGAVLMLSLLPLRRRLRRLEQAAAAIGTGDLSTRVPASGDGDLVDSLGETFNSMAGRIEDLLASHRDLLGSVAHEIRTPLARMRFALELLREGTDAGDGRISRMEADLEALDSLLGELLAYNRLTRTDSLSRERFDLADAASEIADSECWTRQDVETTVSGSAEVLADRRLVSRAVANLVRNAVRHASSRVLVRTGRMPGGSFVEVSDDGGGFDPAVLPRLGEPFVRHAGSPGSGLGLAMVTRIAALHGGSVEYGKAQEGGALVRLFLPG